MLTYQIAYALALSELHAEVRLADVSLTSVRYREIHELILDLLDVDEKYWRLAERFSGR